VESGKSNLYSEFNMDILASRHVECGDWWRAENLSSPFTRIYMVTDGVGYLSYGKTSIEMTAGNAYIIPAGLAVSYYCEKKILKTYFHVSILLQNGYDLLDGIDKCFVFREENMILQITKRLNSNEIKDIIYIKTALYSLICRCIEGNVNYTVDSYSKLTSKAIKYIEANLSSTLVTKDVADALCVSSEQLRKIFCKDTGISIGKYINNRLMSKAELEIRLGKLSIKEISDKLGFCDQFYFSRYFSKKYGVSPMKYRKNINSF